MKRKFLKEICYAGDVYTFLTWKYGIFVDINNNISFAYYGNMRDALNFVYEYSEFGLGKLMLKGTEVWEDKYITRIEELNNENRKRGL